MGTSASEQALRISRKVECTSCTWSAAEPETAVTANLKMGILKIDSARRHSLHTVRKAILMPELPSPSSPVLCFPSLTPGDLIQDRIRVIQEKQELGTALANS